MTHVAETVRCPRMECSPGAYERAWGQALERLEALDAARRIGERDGSLWSADPKVAKAIENRLGWLDLPMTMGVHLSGLKALQLETWAAGVRRVVLLGMGGSSLAPEVMQEVFGRSPEHATLIVLDTTDPAQIRRVANAGDLAETLFIAASKSGTTIEMESLLAFFRERVRERVGASWPRHFIAITDPGTPLDALATEQGFRAIYRNPPDVGGRYSALSLFGLVPGALIGVDLDRLLERAREMARCCRPTAGVAENPGLLLGALMGALAKAQPPCDKLTLLASPPLAPFGAWVEQLIAESTGKQGKGILPVESEPLQEPARYGRDRFFVYLRLEGADNAPLDAFAEELKALGYPLALLPLRDVYDLGAEFFRWEYATAVAGALLEIDPFDQPNVELAKQRSVALLSSYTQEGSLPVGEPTLVTEGLRIYGPSLEARTAGEYIRAFLQGASANGYIALMAYLERSAETLARLQRVRALLGRATGLATTIGYGPRFLHSTGQLHKGGPNTGLFIQITHEEAEDLPIPGQTYTFGVLKQAQAVGDFLALREMGRRVMRLHLGTAVLEDLERLIEDVEKALS